MLTSSSPRSRAHSVQKRNIGQRDNLAHQLNTEDNLEKRLVEMQLFSCQDLFVERR